ncbi:Mcm22p KNAG_0B06790 [Huiozyma naganishii CBS 8797]|uniref:Uncharacterized protein n=1 Tax=Huiozyma naganishii (strain ATCC MYA-139 / BCRC 22969 / CBS 8797 / KCTC 17520 / NBRC 10181 / NCYC 3082 / Yp74L-3) TaxID=1071383 RepID=J7S459_HUIN7|nr:hypothetical protein KNAG_0B06790 [Kazachstania naganishii CBS 8797]CCK69104.1 hypothetical protein KNAG_0B06790 [Kazachstania naganishii CBS 8797]
MTMDAEMLSSYESTLQTQVQNKRHFVTQARDVLRGQDRRDAGPAEGKTGVESLLKRPMMYPERSDPIGVSLLAVSQTTRRTTSLEWLRSMREHNSRLERTLAAQTATNEQLKSLLLALEGSIDLEDQSMPSPPSSRPVEQEQEQDGENASQWAALEELVESRLLQRRIPQTSVHRAVALLRRLVAGDGSIEQTAFEIDDHCAEMYWLLLRHGLIHKDHDHVRLVFCTGR